MNNYKKDADQWLKYDGGKKHDPEARDRHLALAARAGVTPGDLYRMLEATPFSFMDVNIKGLPYRCGIIDDWTFCNLEPFDDALYYNYKQAKGGSIFGPGNAESDTAWDTFIAEYKRRLEECERQGLRAKNNFFAPDAVGQLVSFLENNK